MSVPVERRRSRTAWPGPLSIAGVGKGHDHKLPEALIKRVRLLTVALCVVGACLVALCVLFLLIIAERSAVRDAETERIQQQIRDSWCKALDGLPEGGLLDRLRDDYGCGPGVPLEELPEDIRRRYEPPPPPMGSPAQPNVPAPAPFTPPPDADPDRPVTAPGTEPAPSKPAPSPPGPDDVLPPVTDTVCDLLDICLAE